MLRPGSLALTALLALVTAIGPLSIDLYLPAMPEIGRLLDAPASQVQLTISVYLIGFASGVRLPATRLLLLLGRTGILGGALSGLIRWELAEPGIQIFQPHSWLAQMGIIEGSKHGYNAVVTAS